MKKISVVLIVLLMSGCFKTVVKDPYTYKNIQIIPNKCVNNCGGK